MFTDTFIFSKGAEDSCREIFASVVHMIKKVAVNLSKVAERWAMKKPVRRIDQQLIVVSGRSLISGADMCLGRRLYSSMYAAITDGLVGENTRYETGSLLSRSVHRMRAEVCLHTGLCLRAKCLLYSPQLGGSTGRVVVFHGQLVVPRSSGENKSLTMQLESKFV